MSKVLSEEELSGLCARNDRQAQAELYTRYAARVLTLCRRYSDSADDAYDLMQDSLVKALKMIGSFHYKGPGSLYAWISRLAVNEALDRIRKRRLLFLPLDILPPGETVEPDEDDFGKMSQEEILGIISALPPQQRAVFNMYCIDGYSHREIAGMLGISEKGSAGLLAKARIRLRKEINNLIKNSDR